MTRIAKDAGLSREALYRALRRRPITTESIRSAATHSSLRGPLRRSNPGATTCAAPATQTVVLRPLDCFASLAMTDTELAHLFLRVALQRYRSGAFASPLTAGSPAQPPPSESIRWWFSRTPRGGRRSRAPASPRRSPGGRRQRRGRGVAWPSGKPEVAPV